LRWKVSPRGPGSIARQTGVSAAARRVPPPELWPREPPVRRRLTVADSWLELTLREGRNRQVRRMTAAVGFPTLRLVRIAVGSWRLDGLAPGDFRRCEVHLPLPNRRR